MPYNTLRKIIKQNYNLKQKYWKTTKLEYLMKPRKNSYIHIFLAKEMGTKMSSAQRHFVINTVEAASCMENSLIGRSLGCGLKCHVIFLLHFIYVICIYMHSVLFFVFFSLYIYLEWLWILVSWKFHITITKFYSLTCFFYPKILLLLVSTLSLWQRKVFKISYK